MERLHRWAAAIHDGSGRLATNRARALAAWVRAGETRAHVALRLLVLLAAGYAAVRLIRSRPALLWLAVPAWCIAAARAARPRHPAAPAEAAPGPADGDEAGGISPEQFLALLRAALGPHRGVHLVSLVERLAEEYPQGRWTIPRVRALCAAAGVPVRPTVRAPGRGPTVGVHRDDVPLPSPAGTAGPDEAVVAGQPPATSVATASTTALATVRRGPGGARIVITDDPGNPRRAHVRVIHPQHDRTA
ncbi:MULTISPECIES: hypothetical protein [Streptomycetaceae]|nr:MULTISPECIES: hypothetical protein [Streptomycetaceae]MYS59257.1 hypothetical protein [Streptomyces sp. SID5468]CCB74976.1 conserved protein of unknown function [Streptantibioticus cattleyicolor NRRL 8057 = DSM 46488]